MKVRSTPQERNSLCQHIAASCGGIGCGHGTSTRTGLCHLHPHFTQAAHGEHPKTIRLEALHTAAFVVHANEHIRSNRLDLRTQAEQLALGPSSCEQKESIHQSMVAQASTVVFIQRQTSMSMTTGRAKWSWLRRWRLWIGNAFFLLMCLNRFNHHESQCMRALV